MQPEIVILRKVSQKKKDNTIWYHLHVESKIQHQRTDLQKRNRLTDTENRLVVAKGERFGEEMSGRLRLADTNYYM